MPQRSLNSNTCTTQGGTLSEQSVSRKVVRSPKWWAMFPASVLLDKRLNSESARIYGILALTRRQKKYSVLGVRQIALLLGRSKTTVMKRLKELVKLGHLERVPGKNGSRGVYCLSSPVFEGARSVFREPEYYDQRDNFSNRSVVKAKSELASQPRKRA